MPAGARISAGKLGSVEMSLPNTAESEVNRSPVSCMPSPESPANRITTRSRVLTCFTALRAFFLWRASTAGKGQGGSLAAISAEAAD